MRNEPHKILQSSFRELLSLSMRFGEKLKDKYVWSKEDIDEAHGFLLYFRNNLEKQRQKEIFGEGGDFFGLEPFKRGYNTKSVLFKTLVQQEEKKWVLKIGHRISPVVDYGDPSTHAYFLQHKQHLEILRKHVLKNPMLRYLVPEPQEIIWATVKKVEKTLQTTLALQPYIHIIKAEKIKDVVSEDQKKILLAEFQEFKKLCDVFMKNHKLRPDLLGEGNLEIARIGYAYHVVLLDMGLVDLEAPIPITQTVMYFAALQTLYKWETMLKELPE